MFRNKRFFLYLSKAEAMKKKKREKSPLIQLGTLQRPVSTLCIQELIY